MSHTPGPWTAQTAFENGRFVVAAEGKYLPHTAANARLIAAAPDLLEALEGIVDAVHGRSGGGTSLGFIDAHDDEYDRVLETIAKAKGE